jgi:2-keto-4-pentenoate hydratase/2-oxohepta-3-ene-1,7-dioic acid hydratase in catechol pathway
VQQELKKKGLPWEKAKAWDNSAMVGEWTDLSPEMLRKPFNFSMDLNGETVQKGSSADMVFSFDRIVANISQYFSLNIGDLIFTGTPAGVGECVVGDESTGYLDKKQVFSLTVK